VKINFNKELLSQNYFLFIPTKNYFLFIPTKNYFVFFKINTCKNNAIFFNLKLEKGKQIVSN